MLIRVFQVSYSLCERELMNFFNGIEPSTATVPASHGTVPQVSSMTSSQSVNSVTPTINTPSSAPTPPNEQPPNITPPNPPIVGA